MSAGGEVFSVTCAAKRADEPTARRNGFPMALRRTGRRPSRRLLAFWRVKVKPIAPYILGAVMFAVAIWVLRSTLRRYHLADPPARRRGTARPFHRPRTT